LIDCRAPNLKNISKLFTIFKVFFRHTIFYTIDFDTYTIGLYKILTLSRNVLRIPVDWCRRYVLKYMITIPTDSGLIWILVVREPLYNKISKNAYN